MLTTFVSVLNAIGWIVYYIASGGFLESSETAQVRMFTIITIILASVAAAVIGYVFRGAFEGLFSNIINHIFCTALCMTPFVFCFYGSLYWTQRVWGFILFSIVFIFYIVLFCSQIDIIILVKLVAFVVVLVVATGFTDRYVAEYAMGSGIMIGGIPALINGIYNYMKYDEF